MGAFVTSAENAFLNLLLRNEDWTGIGDSGGLRGSATAGSLWLSACTTWPGETADQTSGEAGYTGYVRAAITRGSSAWNSASSGSISPVNPIPFGKRTDAGAQVDICYVVLGTASSGVGTALLWGAIGDPVFAARPFSAASTASDTIRIPGHGLVATDRIAFFNYEPAPDLPGGLTEGTVYFVRSTGLTTDEFTIATTSGGAAVDITTLGTGYAIKIKPIPVTQNINPEILASAALRLS